MVKTLKLNTHQWTNHKHHHVPEFSIPPSTVPLEFALTATWKHYHTLWIKHKDSNPLSEIVTHLHAAQQRCTNLITADSRRGDPSIRVTLVPVNETKAHKIVLSPKALFEALKNDSEMRAKVYAYTKSFLDKKEWRECGTIKTFVPVDERNLRILRKAVSDLGKVTKVMEQVGEEELMRWEKEAEEIPKKRTREEVKMEVESRMSIPEISLAVKPGDLAAEKMVGMENVRPPEVATEE